jgi:hypothetical protein
MSYGGNTTMKTWKKKGGKKCEIKGEKVKSKG